MPRAILNSVGTTTAALTVDLGNARILFADGARVAIVNEAESAIRGTITSGNLVNVNEQGETETSFPFVVDGNSSLILSVTKEATTGNAGEITIASGGVATTHGTAVDTGDYVYLARIDN